MNTIDAVTWFLTGIILLISSIKDIKTKRISMKILITGAILLFICLPFRREISVMEGLLGTLVGLMMIGIGKITKWQIGMGDGMILIFTGIGLGFRENTFLLLCALFLIFIFSIILIPLKKITSKTSLPFIPFLFLGYLGLIVSKFQ